MEDRNETAARVAQMLAQSETAVDQAYSALAGFAASLPEFQTNARLSAVYGHELFDMLTRAQSKIVEARGEVVQAHNRLAALQRKLRIDVVATGPVDKPDPGQEPGGPIRPTGVEPFLSMARAA
jgi:hypothetical protein